MTSTYTFEFEKNETSIKVHFVDETSSIEVAESLAQIPHFYRRSWATSLVNVMNAAGVSSFQYYLEDIKEKCPFEKRLVAENWNDPFVSLMQTTAQQALYVYRLYIFYFYMCKLFIHALIVTPSSKLYPRSALQFHKN